MPVRVDEIAEHGGPYVTEFTGLDPEAVDQLGDQIQSASQTLEGIRAGVTALINHASTFWHGPDLDAFSSYWFHQNQPATQRAIDALSGLGQSAKNNATEQRTASGQGTGTRNSVQAGADHRGYQDPSVVTSTIGFGVVTAGGWILNASAGGSTTTSYNSDGTVEVEATSKTSGDFNVTQLVKTAEFLAAPEAAIADTLSDQAKLEAHFGGDVGTAKIVTVRYDDVGSTTRVQNTFVQGQAGWSKLVTGYDEPDLKADIDKVGRPWSSITTTSAEGHGTVTVGLDVNPGVGPRGGEDLSLSASASAYQTVYSDHSIGSGFNYQGSADVSGHVDLGPFTPGADAGGTLLGGGSAEIIRDPFGHVLQVVVSQHGSASATTGVHSPFGFSSESQTNSYEWSKTTTYSMDDPAVVMLLGAKPNVFDLPKLLGGHPDLGQSTVVVDHLTTDSNQGSIGVYSVGSAESSSVSAGASYRSPGQTEWKPLALK